MHTVGREHAVWALLLYGRFFLSSTAKLLSGKRAVVGQLARLEDGRRRIVQKH